MREPEQRRCAPASRWRVQAFSVAALALACLYAASCGGGGGMETPGNPVPQISSASPGFALVGAGDTTVTVTGSGFISSSSVMISGTTIKTTFVSSTRLTAVIPAADQTSVGKLTLTVANPPPGGGTSAGAEFDVVAAALNVTIIDLPVGTAGSVTVTRPDGSMVQLTASATVSGSTGTYTIAAAGVAVASSTYRAVTPTQTAKISTGSSASVTVDYYDIIPNTTKALDQTGMQTLTVSSDGNTLTISNSSEVAQSLRAGDVLVSGPTNAARQGLLVKVVSATQSGSNVVVNTSPASLSDEVTRARINVTIPLKPSGPTSHFRQPRQVFTVHAPHGSASASLSNPCAGNSSEFTLPVGASLPPDSAGNTVSASGEVDLCASALVFDIDTGSLSGTLSITLQEYASVGVQGRYSVPFNQTIPLDLSELTDQVVCLGNDTCTSILGLPESIGTAMLVLTPVLTPFVGLAGNANGGFCTGGAESGQFEAGLTIQNGQLSSVHNGTLQLTSDPNSLDGSLSVKGFAGVTVGLELFGSVTGHVDPDAYAQLNADAGGNPWWNVVLGEEADAGLTVSLLGFFSHDFDTKEFQIYSGVAAHAGGPFSAQPAVVSISPNSAMVGSPDVALAVIGSNFVPGAFVSFNGIRLRTSFTDPDNLTAILPTTDLALPGVFPVTVTNPDTTGATSAAINFTVTGTAAPVLTSVSPTSIVVGSFTLSVVGTNFVSGAQVFFGSTALATTFVSSTQLTASGTASVSQVGSVAVTATNPGSGSSNALSAIVANVSGGSSGSTGIIVGNVNGKIVDKAYVPLPNSDLVSVINVDAASGTNSVVTSIPMPNFYSPSATAADQAMLQVVVISDTSPDVQIIDASQDKLIATVTSPVTQSATFSAGFNLCMICGVSIDPTTNTAILDTAQGLVLLNLTTRQFSAFIAGTAAGENFGYNPNTLIVLNPTYYQNVPPGLQAISLSNNAVSTYSTPLNSNPDSAAVDLNTNIAVVPDEYTGNQFLINMAVASFSSGSFSAPDTVYNTSFTNCITSQAANEWTMVSIESSTHILFLGTEFGDCSAVEPLPTAPVSSAPSSPTTFNWGHMPSAPDGLGWSNGTDPHGIGVFTSVVNGKAYGFLVRSDQAWVARIDLVGVAGASPLSGGLQGQVDLSPYVTFFKTQ